MQCCSTARICWAVRSLLMRYGDRELQATVRALDAHALAAQQSWHGSPLEEYETSMTLKARPIDMAMPNAPSVSRHVSGPWSREIGLPMTASAV